MAMTPNDFRKLALSFPATAEHAHMNHPDFRVAGKIFATLGYPSKERAMVKVTPLEQEMLVRAEPAVFAPRVAFPFAFLAILLSPFGTLTVWR